MFIVTTERNKYSANVKRYIQDVKDKVLKELEIKRRYRSRLRSRCALICIDALSRVLDRYELGREVKDELKRRIVELIEML